MKVLMFSTDRKVFDVASPVRARILEYGKLFEELHVIIYTRPGFSKEQIGNITLEPTNTRFRLAYFSKAFRLGKSVLESGGSWVVTSQDPFETGWVAYRLKKSFGVPFQAQAHTDFLSPYFKNSSLKNRLRSLLGLWIIRRADRIRVVSERIRSSLLAADRGLSEKVVVLPIFVDIQKFRDAKQDPTLMNQHKPNNEFLILTVARFEQEKNLSLAGEIVRDIQKDNGNVRWLLAGSGSQVNPGKEAEREVARDPKELPRYYKIADLFLLTSNYEGYGMAAVEAAAAGIPVVMTGVGVALGATFPVGGKEKAVAIIKELIKNPEKRRQLIEKQNEFFKNWPTHDQYLEQYKESLTF